MNYEKILRLEKSINSIIAQIKKPRATHSIARGQRGSGDQGLRDHDNQNPRELLTEDQLVLGRPEGTAEIGVVRAEPSPIYAAIDADHAPVAVRVLDRLHRQPKDLVHRLVEAAEANRDAVTWQAGLQAPLLSALQDLAQFHHLSESELIHPKANELHRLCRRGQRHLPEDFGRPVS